MELQVEQEYFERIRQDLLRRHPHKFALVHDSQLLGVYTTAEEAYVAGVRKLGNRPFLVREIMIDEKIVQAPALTFGLLRARP